jgi:hypothetical protein
MMPIRGVNRFSKNRATWVSTSRAISRRLRSPAVSRKSDSETARKYPPKAVKSVADRIRRPPLALSLALALGPYGSPAEARTDPPPPHHMNLPKPTPPGGDDLPFVVRGSSTRASAPTVAVIGDSVARDYAYYLAQRLGPRGVRVIDGALSGCPVGTLPLLFTTHGVTRRPREGGCPRTVVNKQQAVVNGFSPKLVLWHSLIEIWDVDAGTRVQSGSPEWARRVRTQWDDTLRRISRGGAQVVVILPLWYEHGSSHRLDAPGPSVEKLRDLYTRWAVARGVTVVDVAPLVCPSGPPCEVVNGIDFRPDTTHFDDPGGAQVAAYLESHVPALARLAHGV